MKKLALFFLFFLVSANLAIAVDYGNTMDYDKTIDYSQLDYRTYLKDANIDMILYEKSQLKEDQDFYLDKAMRNFYLVTKINGGVIEAMLGMARVYDEMKKDKSAKKYFYQALNIDYYNPDVNFYFANYYFKRKDYRKALEYYKIAQENGYYGYEINLNQGVIYEKLADLRSAKIYYKKALSLKPDNAELSEKIRLLDELNYDNSQYYLNYEYN